MNTCQCGCGKQLSDGKTTHNVVRSYISGHNLRNMEKTKLHCQRISEGQIMAWQTKRKRLPIGSTHRHTDGYIRVKMLSGSGRWKLQHHLVMEQKLGRPVRKGEIVHHLNCQRNDNRPENLILCSGKSHHASVHKSLDVVVSRLIKQGVITFSNGKYRLA